MGGPTLDELETVEHNAEMLSLQASEEKDEVRDWIERVHETVGEVDYVLEPKFDGFSIELVYEDGELARAVTRGDGATGDEVTANVRTIGQVPLQLREAPDELAVRGEIYMSIPGFQNLNEERIEQGKEPFANPRNAAAGTVRLLDPDKVADRPLSFFVYDVLETSEGAPHDHGELLEALAGHGFPVSELSRHVQDADAFISYREELLDERDELAYEIDGAIAKVADRQLWDELGTTASHPRWAFAYKFPAETGETTVQRIAVQVGRTGQLTPIALLEPVDVQGVTISRASLHNEEQVRELGVTEGARVQVERAGDVIPQVEEVPEEGDGEPFSMPETCPVCDSQVVEEGPRHFCTGGLGCSAQLRGRLELYGSRQVLDIEGLGEETAQALVEQGLVEQLPDLYDLEPEDLLELDRFAEKSAENLVTNIQESREPTLASFLYGLGIRHIGRDMARRLSEAFTLDELMEADEEALKALDGVGDEVAESVHRFFDSEAGGGTVESLLEAGVAPQRRERGGELEGLTLVFTGDLEGWTRQEAKSLVERHGAQAASSVSSNTNYLIVGEDPGSKLDEARERDVETLNEEGFQEEILAQLDGA